MTPSSRLPLALRGLGLLVLAGFMLVAAGSGIDRMAAYAFPQLRPLVPAPFAAMSLSAKASEDMVAARGDTLLPLAKTVIAKEPFEPVSPSYLGAAYWLAHRNDKANTAFLVAADMGWRAPMTQIYWLEQAVVLRDGEVAMTRLDALLRQKPTAQSDRGVMDPVERSQDMRPALLSLLATRPDWLGLYVANIAYMPIDQLVNRAGILVELGHSGTHLGCGSPISEMVSELARVGQYGLARQLWASHCPAAGQSALWDGALTTVSPANGNNPFAWQTHTSGDVNLDLVTDGSGKTKGLTISNSGSFTAPFLSQTLLLAEGAHRIVWRADGRAQPDLLIQYICGNGGNETRPVITPAQGDHRWQASLIIPPACPYVRLDFVAKAGANNAAFGPVRLED